MKENLKTNVEKSKKKSEIKINIVSKTGKDLDGSQKQTQSKKVCQRSIVSKYSSTIGAIDGSLHLI